jgi:acyl-CoA synthetase (AMP-forming)/AMP-acid ligase II
MGYWNSPEATASCFDRELRGAGPGFLRTGDLGFLDRGELYVTSREKDLIIIHGRNHSPADIEQAVEYAHPAIRAGACAAFSVDSDEGNNDDGECLVVVAETREHSGAAQRSAAFEAASSAVFRQHGIVISELVLIPRRAIPRTSSGKLQRRAARARYMDGALEVLASLTPGSAARPKQGVT